MSSSSSRNLMGLFSGGADSDSQSDDPLKYRAPREPKRGSSLFGGRREPAAAPAPAPAPAPSAAASAASAASSAAAAAEVKQEAKPEAKRPQFSFSSRVRLFRLNPATQSYDTWCDGQLLGCVILLNDTSQQLLIYDAAKQPQCTALLSVARPRLSLTNQRYLSFMDDQGNGWSALFESEAAARLCLKHSLAACAEKGATEPIKVMVAPAAAGGTPLESGDSAGILLKAHELGSGGYLENDKMFAVYENEVCKVSLQEGQEEPIGGLISQIIGCSKGDVFMVLLPPAIAMGGVGSRSNRTNPDAWVLAEVTVAKVKSKSSAAAAAAAAAASTKATAPVSEESPTTSSSSSSSSSSSTAARMAALAQKSGSPGAGLLADAIADRHPVENKTPFASQSQAQPQQQQAPQQQQQQHHSGAATAVADGQSPYAIAVVPGQEARSAYLPPSGPQYAGGYSSQPAVDQPGWGSMVIQQQQQTQQSILSIQTALIELHSKLDRMSQQQQYPSQLAVRGLNDPNTGMRMKAADLIAHVTAMVEEYEQVRQSAGRDDGRIDKLQERIDRLTEKNEQLLAEKTALLEKHADALQKSSDNNQRSFALQQELSTAKAENASLQAQLRAAEAENATLQRQLDELRQGAQGRADQGRVVEQLQQEVRQLKEQLAEERDRAASAAASAQAEWERERADLRRQLEQALSRPADLTAALQSPEAQAMIAERAAELAKQSESSSCSPSSAEVETLQQRVKAQEEELAELRNKLAEAGSNGGSAGAGSAARMTPDDIKKIMSDVFGCISDAVDAMEVFNADTVMEQVKRVLRDVTKRTLAEL